MKSSPGPGYFLECMFNWVVKEFLEIHILSNLMMFKNVENQICFTHVVTFLTTGPSLLDYGKVCLRSISTKNLEILNNLDQNVLVVAEVSSSC